MVERYPYDEAWRQSVDHTGESWRAYCEALSCVKRFLRTEASLGREEAKREWQQHLAATEARRGPGGVERLKQDFILIGTHEGNTLRGRPEVNSPCASRQDDLFSAPPASPPSIYFDLAEQAA